MKTAIISVKLRLETSGGVTAPEALATADEILPLRKLTNGHPHLPGTTVAGSLRAHCRTRTEFAGDGTAPLFGGEPGEEKPAASAIQILGTTCTPSADAVPRRRTAIDRERGGPANLHLHGIERLPRGTTFEIVLRWDAPDERWEPFKEHLMRWRPRIGRGSSVGAGVCTVVGLGEQIYDLGDPDGLLAWIQDSSAAQHPEPRDLGTSRYEPRPLLDEEVVFKIVEPLHVGTGEQYDGESSKVNSVVRDGDSYVVPGSTLKGVFRSRAEYICRVLGHDACLDQMCGRCRPCRLFGYAGKTRDARRSKIVFYDAPISAEQDPAEERKHVVLDRFTGGARDQLLFTDEVVTHGSFEVRIEEFEPDHDSGRSDRVNELDKALLKAVIRDLHDGLIGIGGRTTAGYGTVRLHGSPPALTDLTAIFASEAA
ncbi:RAMP superfamily CRISPR-associated protein [Saccharopolyspora sp. TS4A08]|uniref:RAMP superfamily CRISPR-associated protein n=1 Tax=Saccharopolyspora ipomoeae TaxID=3042027 RepID=A0ABT6PND6_9PSEU|nr:RAMP superfamily CRISPR-associated protein [Saccharopolyspora sp. TS4A08]MDI2029511.1 RAMP superfamily CRISPR-associated protein [Saccharopolyspora sp. TS4A08]